MPPELEQALDEMILTQMFNDNATNKTLAYANMRKCDLYWNGKQFLSPVMDASGNVTDWTELPPFGTDGRLASLMTGTTATRGRYDITENWVQGDGNKFVAVVGAKSPNPRCEPLNSKDTNAEALAKIANQILEALRKLWPVEAVHKQLCLHAWKDGTYFLHTPYEQSAEKYGYRVKQEQVAEPITVVQWQCSQCGHAQSQASSAEPPACSGCQQPMVPVRETTETVTKIVESREPGMAPGLYASSMYEVTIPFFLKVLQFQQSPWLIYQDEPHRGTLLEMYPEFMNKINGDVTTAELLNDTISQVGYITRNMRTNVNKDLRMPSRYQWMRTIVWMKPTQYWMFGNRGYIDGNQTVRFRDWLRSKYPTGCKITRIGRHVVDIQPENFSDHWAIGTPMVSTNVYCDPICWPFLQFVDAINSTDNLFIENMERNIPMTLANRNMLNIEAITSRQGVPGEMVPVDMEVGTDLASALYNLPTAKLDGQNFGFRNEMLESGREITGVQRAIFGAGNASTAHEAELQKTQAMMQLGLAWSNLRDCWRQAYTNALRMLGRYGADVLHKFGLSHEAIELAGQLVDEAGNLNGIHVIVDEGIPATWGQIHDTVTFMMQQNPQSQQAVGIGSPANASLLQNALGLTDWNVPGSDAKNYVKKLIDRLLAGQVMQPPVDPMTGQPQLDPMGQPLPPQPSEVINALILPQELGMPLFQQWFMSDDGMEAPMRNPQGFENLMAAVTLYATPPMPPPGQEGGDPGNEQAPGPGGPTVGPQGGRGEAPALQPGNVMHMGKR